MRLLRRRVWEVAFNKEPGHLAGWRSKQRNHTSFRASPTQSFFFFLISEYIQDFPRDCSFGAILFHFTSFHDLSIPHWNACCRNPNAGSSGSTGSLPLCLQLGAALQGHCLSVRCSAQCWCCLLQGLREGTAIAIGTAEKTFLSLLSLPELHLCPRERPCWKKHQDALL